MNYVNQFRKRSNIEEEIHANQCRAKVASGKAKQYLEKMIKFGKKQLDKIREDIKAAIKEDKSLKVKNDLLISYKGIGEKTASVLLIELPELGVLSNQEIASLVGLAPKTSQSGQKTNGAHIRGGRFFVRKSLYMVALVAMRHNDKMKALYERMTNAGKKAKVALVVLVDI